MAISQEDMDLLATIFGGSLFYVLTDYLFTVMAYSWAVACLSDERMQAMFGNEYWQIERVISEPDLISKANITLFSDEVETYILPELKEKDGKDLRDGKAVDILVYEEDTKKYFNLKLQYQQPFYHLSDTTELFEFMGLTPGRRLGFRYEGWFATLVVKILK